MNYQKELEKIIKGLDSRPGLLLHSCCAPCSSYCLEYLSSFFRITVFYYNPNITIREEYDHRITEQKRLIEEMNARYNLDINFASGKYEPERFFETIKGMEKCPEGGERCRRCFDLRLGEAAGYASDHGFDFFTTTLTISPLKNADILNELGNKKAKEYNIAFLPSDFKKNNGYKRSIELSAEYGLYRQNYCGCIFSKNESMLKKQERI